MTSVRTCRKPGRDTWDQREWKSKLDLQPHQSNSYLYGIILVNRLELKKERESTFKADERLNLYCCGKRTSLCCERVQARKWVSVMGKTRFIVFDRHQIGAYIETNQRSSSHRSIYWCWFLCSNIEWSYILGSSTDRIKNGASQLASVGHGFPLFECKILGGTREGA